MDTIIYLYRWRQPEQIKQINAEKSNQREKSENFRREDLYCREDYALLDYQLIKVGMSEKLLRICEENAAGPNSRRTKEPGGFFERRRRKKQREQESLLLAEFLQEIRANTDGCNIVCEETFPYFAGREFNGYFQAGYVRHLLRYCGFSDDPSGGNGGAAPVMPKKRESGEQLHHFIILGQTGCVSELVYELVGGMKGLKWILPGRLFRQEQQELVDVLYEEYGLAVEVKLFEEDEGFARVYPACRIPSIVLDFSETDRVPTVDVARGSIWLDMASSEEKRRRIEDRDTGIQYFSLKKEWKQPQKALNYLDTTSKNGYNT